MSKALDIQVGGDHYKKLKIQPMEYSMANGLNACQHTIIKYVTRYPDKNGVEDLKKARHTIDLLIDFLEADQCPATGGFSNTAKPTVPYLGEIPDGPRPPGATHWHAHSEHWVALGTESGFSYWADGWISVPKLDMTVRWVEGLRPIVFETPKMPPGPSESQATHREPGGTRMKRCELTGRWLKWGNNSWYYASSDENYEPTDLIAL